jgi:expansin (peptidoglycan-binding protein)
VALTSPVKVALVVAAALLLGGCSQVRWVAITAASASGPDATSMDITIDGCVGGADMPNPRVIESDTEVHLLIDLKLDYGNTKACMSGTIVHLDRPIGTRKVIDDRRHRVVPITWLPIATP